MASARQMASQVKKHGARNASWLCFWRDLDGRQRSKAFGAGTRGKRAAENYAKQVEAELTLLIDEPGSVTWQQFRKEFEASRHDLSESRQTFTSTTLSQFERISRPKRLDRSPLRRWNGTPHNAATKTSWRLRSSPR